MVGGKRMDCAYWWSQPLVLKGGVKHESKLLRKVNIFFFLGGGQGHLSNIQICQKFCCQWVWLTDRAAVDPSDWLVVLDVGEGPKDTARYKSKP